MRYIKTYEENIHRKNSCIGLKRGDIVVYIRESDDLINGNSYIISDILWWNGSQLKEKEIIGDDEIIYPYSFYIVLKEMNGKQLKSKDGDDNLFRIEYFVPEVEWEANKYNL